MNKDEQNQQELMMKLGVFEQQIRQLQQQIAAIDQALTDMTLLNTGLDELVGKKDKEIFAPIGRGIFARAKLISEDLLVDIGDKKLIKKNIPQTKEMVAKQIRKIQDVKKDLEQNLEQVGKETERILGASQ